MPRCSRRLRATARGPSAPASDGRLAIAQPVPDAGEDLPALWHQEVDARAELDQAQRLAAVHRLAGREVADDAAGDEAGDLPHADAVAVGALDHRQVRLVDLVDVGLECRQLLAAGEGRGDDDA